MEMITKRNLVLILAIIAVVGGAILLFYSRTPMGAVKSEKINVVASFYSLANAANVVGGNLVSARNLVPSGVEPHDFEPSSRDFVDIGNADILLYNGGGLEPWVQKWEQGGSSRPKQTINMANALKGRGVNLLENKSAVDPHFWLNPTMMKREVEVVRDALIQIDPAHKEMFDTNAKRFLDGLDSLDNQFRAGLSSCTLHDIVVGHEAFNYLAHQYGFMVTSIAGISPDEEPAPKDLARIISLVKEKGVKYIFFESVASPKFSELIAREVGGSTLVLNPLESLTPNEVQSGEDYISIMEKNLNNLRIAMSCN